MAHPHAPEPDQNSTRSADVERLARRASRNIAFRRRCEPQHFTQPGQVERALTRIRSAMQRRAGLA